MLASMASRSASALGLLSSFWLLAACDSSVVGGGGPGGGGGAGGGEATTASGPSAPSGDTSSSTSNGQTSGDGVGGDAIGTTASTGTGDLPSDVEGAIVPRDAAKVTFLLGNSPRSCAAPQPEPPCAPGERWVAAITIPRADLAPGTYALGGAEIPIGVAESFDDCSGGGGRGWSGDPAWLTIESIDAAHAVITIEGAYDDVDGTWDVPLCGDVAPAG